ncbi:MAG: DUF2231 domain-containing protein [Methanoregulaceae archaeon]|nr:DUF2231 domain-containing protein [Methanoregulaceae archaeon]
MMGRVCLLVAMVLGVCASAHAKPEFWNAYREHFKLENHFPNYKAGCLNCHAGVPKRNAFGRKVEAAMIGRAQLTAEVLAPLEKEDTDGDGWPNAEEIRAGFLPADPRSHPEGTPPGPVNPIEVEEAAIETVSIPNHRFHPLVIHFPIALFLFGAFLDVLGYRRGDDGLRRLALWNLGFGAAVSVVAVITGLLALFALGWELQGAVLAHLAFGLTASASMLATFFVRRKGDPPTKPGYWMLLAFASLATIVAGHLGSSLVFGS